MAGSTSGSLRGSGSARITFFVFLDIITAVTGILILVILLFALRAGNEAGAPRKNSGANRPYADPAIEAALAARLAELERLSQENHHRNLELTDAENTADAADLRADLASLRAELTQARTALLPPGDPAHPRVETGATRDDATGLTADRAQIDQARARLARLNVENAAKRQQNEKLELDVKTAESRLLAAQAYGKNKLFLIPELPDTSKAPVLVVVAGPVATIERYNQPTTRQTIQEDGDGSRFRQTLARFNRLDDYIVFYVRPSGIERFDKYLKETRNAGFEVGYDAVDENRELIFAPRTDKN